MNPRSYLAFLALDVTFFLRVFTLRGLSSGWTLLSFREGLFRRRGEISLLAHGVMSQPDSEREIIADESGLLKLIRFS